jgi:hypothetical protein
MTVKLVKVLTLSKQKVGWAHATYTYRLVVMLLAAAAAVLLMWRAWTRATTSSPTCTGEANLRVWFAYTAPGCTTPPSRGVSPPPVQRSTKCQRGRGRGRGGTHEAGGDGRREEGRDEHAVDHAAALEPARLARGAVVEVHRVAVAAHRRVCRHVRLREAPPLPQRVADPKHRRRTRGGGRGGADQREDRAPGEHSDR